MIQDLHSHTYYSLCGKDTPDEVIETAIKNGVEFLAITDHCHGVVNSHPELAWANNDARVFISQIALRKYYDHIKTAAYKYRDYINVWCGIEVTTIDHGWNTVPDEGLDFSFFDFCFIENIEKTNSTIEDMFAFNERLGCKL